MMIDIDFEPINSAVTRRILARPHRPAGFWSSMTLAAVACVFITSTNARADDEIVLGMSTALTGPAAELDTYASRLDSGRSPVVGSEDLGPKELALEALMFGLRRHEGVDLDHVEALCGIDIERANQPLIARLCADGMLVRSGRRWIPTRAGLAVADGLASGFALEAIDRG